MDEIAREDDKGERRFADAALTRCPRGSNAEGDAAR